jgi:sulfur relay (sulfurtransferase) DsrF/TusC family protein
MKKVAIVVRSSPFNTIRFAEALRIGIGQTLADNQVDLFLVGEGAWNALAIQPSRIGRPDVSESLALLGPCRIRLFADSDALTEDPFPSLHPSVEKVPRADIWKKIMDYDVILHFKE